MKLKKRYMQWLHILHVLTISIWFGSVVCLAALSLICFFKLDKTEFITIAPLIPALYRQVVMPAALFTIIQGIIYGFFSNWGFFKYRWILYKWLLVVLTALCTGLGGINQMLNAINKADESGFTGGFADGGLALLFVFLQIIFMIIMVGLSVFKPMKNKQKN
jgi:uncharacterized membrane protein